MAFGIQDITALVHNSPVTNFKNATKVDAQIVCSQIHETDAGFSKDRNFW